MSIFYINSCGKIINQRRDPGLFVKGIENASATLKAETLAITLNQQQEAERQIQALKQDHIKAVQRTKQQQLIAPIDGTVQELVITTLGGVVTPAQALMKIVPKDSQLEIEAMIANQDIGFIEEGQIVAVKLDAFPFTKYGLIDGEIKTLSRDAKIDEELGLVFLARVLLKQHSININGKEVGLTSGMNATVEVKTGKRKLIEYFLAPLLRYKQESIRER